MRIFKKLDIFMLRQFLTLLSGTFFISLFVLMMQFLWRYVDDLIGKGLSLEVLGQFFWYMGLMMVPQALPLGVLLASLITMGNLGESSELTAIKASGISLLKSLRGLIIFSCIIAVVSFIFQNNIGPKANIQLRQLLLSMRQKSPELEIPEEIFYSGIPGCNLYVQHKDMERGVLYGVMIYRMTESFEDAAIILADSGRLQSTADKQHLKLTLYSGEWFENMRSQQLTQNSNVPYRRESFMEKVILLDFDNGFNLAEASGISQMAQAQSIPQLLHHIDSVHHTGDSIGRAVRKDIQQFAFNSFLSNKKVEGGRGMKEKGREKRDEGKEMKEKVNMDTLFAHLPSERQLLAVQQAAGRIQQMTTEMEFRSAVATDYNQRERDYKIEVFNKFTLSLICIVFFFIGASLGAIIRKGGLGVPVIISVLVFILFYMLDNTGYRMAQNGAWTIAFGKGLPLGVLIPLATFVTYKANKDSVVFNWDSYRHFFISLLGLRIKRNISSKEVIINDPDYTNDALRLQHLSLDVEHYAEEHHLVRLPNPINVFFHYQPDHEVERICKEMEEVIEDLGNTRDRFILSYINQYPVVSEKAHTRPFDRPWLNKVAAVILPVGVVLYIRMCRFRLRLYKDLKLIRKTNELIIERIKKEFHPDSH